MEYHFDVSQVASILKDMIRIPTENPPGGEDRLARYIGGVLEQNGIETRVSEVAPGRSNLIAWLGGREPGRGPLRSLLLNGHLDTVPAGPGWAHDPFAGDIAGDRLYGRGAADMKGGLAALVCAFILLRRSRVELGGRLILCLSCDEERTNTGIKHFISDELAAVCPDGLPDGAVVGEPTGLDVCPGCKGVARFRLATFGTAAHAGKVACPDNAITKMARLILRLEEYDRQLRSESHRILGTRSLTVGTVKGGTAPNVVPDRCEVELDRRLFPGETLETAGLELKELIAGAFPDPRKFPYELIPSLYIGASLLDEEHPLVGWASQAVLAETGEKPGVRGFLAASDAFFLSEAGIPTLICGPGDLDGAHVVDESISLAEVERATRVYVRLAVETLGRV